MAAREENDAGEIFRTASAKDFGSPFANFAWDGGSLVLFSGDDHVDLENDGVHLDFFFAEFFKEFCENGAGDGGGSLDRIVAVVNKLWLDDGDDMRLLAKKGIGSEKVGIFFDGVFGRSGSGKLEGGAPFGEAKPHFVIFGKAWRKTS